MKKLLLALTTFTVMTFGGNFGDGMASYVLSDYTEAAKYWSKCADAGDALCQVGIGSLYDNGLGVQKDYKKAANFYRKAADQGDAEGQSKLAEMYAFGLGVEKNNISDRTLDESSRTRLYSGRI